MTKKGGGSSSRRCGCGQATDLSDAHFVAVVPAASLCFDGVQVLSAKMFSQNAKDAGGVVLDLLGDSQVGGSPAGGSDEKLQQRLAEQSDKVVTGASAIKDPVSRIASEYSAEKDPPHPSPSGGTVPPFFVTRAFLFL